MISLKGVPCKTRLLLQCNKDENTQCWNWQGSKDRNGYGYVKQNGKTTKAHRASYIEFKGIIPENLWILHRCNNPSCINPEHLYAGTPTENMRDRERAGRHKGWKGCNKEQLNNPNVKLTPEDAVYIRTHYRWGLGPTLARMFNISVAHLNKVRRGNIW